MLKKTFCRYWETVRDILYFCWKGAVPREMRRPRAPISLVARSSLTHLQHLSSLPQSDIANRHQCHYNCLLVQLERGVTECVVQRSGYRETERVVRHHPPPASTSHLQTRPPPSPPLYILTSTCSMVSTPQHGTAGLYAGNHLFVTS